MKACTSVILPLPNGLKLALRSQQQLGCARFIMKEIFKNQVYSRPGFELRATDTVVDIGGNIGMFALWAAPQAARVVSIEPTKAIDCLEESLVLNDLGNVNAVRCAVGSEAGTLEMMEYPGFNAVTHLATLKPSRFGQGLIKLLWPKDQEPPIRTSCPCQTLEDVLQAQNVEHVDFLKVDCEGGEYAIFKTISDETLSRISRIAMEFHELHADHDHRQIVNRLKSAGYDVTIKRELLDRLVHTGMLWARRKP